MKNATVEFFPDQANANGIKILMKGELTIGNIDEFKIQIVQQAKEKDIINIKIEEVEGIDLPFYQFLVSLKKTLESNNQQMMLEILLPEDKKDLFNKSGLDFNIN